MSNGSRLVVYYNDDSNPISLGDISTLPYTHVIIGFLVPADPLDGNFTLVGSGGAFDDDLQSNIGMLQKAGKNVLISVGGQINTALQPGQAGFTSAAWQHYAKNVGDLVQHLGNYVGSNGLDGVDIDFEDNTGFTGVDDNGDPACNSQPVWNGVQFLADLTNALPEHLPPGIGLVTHAPAPNYFDPNGCYNNAYTQIWEQAGDSIALVNCQFYNNGAYDMTAQEKITWYNNIAAVTGSEKLMLGAPITVADTVNGDGDGYLPPDQLIDHVITPLTEQAGGLGGVMGWEFAHDAGGSWGQAIRGALQAGSGFVGP